MPRGVYERKNKKKPTKKSDRFGMEPMMPDQVTDTMSGGSVPTPPPKSTLDYPIDQLPSDRATRVVQDRHDQYGPPEWIYASVARVWNIWLGIQDTEDVIRPIDTSDVAMMQLILKVFREQSRHHDDNLTDIAGYANVYHLIREAQ